VSKLSDHLRRRHTLKRKDVKKLLEEAREILGVMQAERVEEAEYKNGKIVYLLEGVVTLFSEDGVLYPTLKCDCINNLPSILVDMGAIPYICNGADIMAPGIVEIIGAFEKGDIVVVRDVTYKKPLCIGKTLKSSLEIEKSKKGKVVMNHHYVGDDLWGSIN
jgi:PUA domain protein